MAKIAELNDGWNEWVRSQPKCIQDLCERLPPNRLYKLHKSRVIIHSYSENGTVTVSVLADFNLVIFERNVFGVSPEDLVECDLPKPGTILGRILTDEKDIFDYCAKKRSFINKVKRMFH